MTSNDTAILSNILVLDNKVLANDAGVEDAVNAINAITATFSDYDVTIRESIQGILEKATTDNKAVISKIISTLTSLATSKDVMLAMLDAHTVNVSNSVEVAQLIDSSLASTVNDFSYFNYVVKLAIMLADRTRIEATITKIQSLGVN